MQTLVSQPGRFRRAMLFPPIRAVLGFFWVGGAIGLGSGASGLLPVGMAAAAPLLLAIGALLGYYAFVRIVERRPVVELLSPGSLKEAGIGAVIGVGLFSVVIGLIYLLGNYSATVAKSSVAVVPALMAAVMAGVTEELLIRAVAFRILETWLGSWLALSASAILFGLLHLPNPEATALSTVAIALEAGVMLAAAYMVTRRVWLAVGIHIAWNFTQSGIFGVPTSGSNTAGYLEGHLHGSALLSGGAFGPEASIVSVAVCLALGVYFLWLANIKGHVLQPSWRRVQIAA